jgi:hypothetical protein
MAPAARVNVIVDFTGFVEQTMNLLNLGPDEPFGVVYLVLISIP